MKKKKPDLVADNPGLLPYGSNVGAPAIKPDDIDSWRRTNVIRANNYFESKFVELKQDYQKLIEEYRWTDLIYKAKYSFEPIIGKIYYLYLKNDNDELFLSLIAPNEWKISSTYIGAFKFDSKNKWEKQDI